MLSFVVICFFSRVFFLISHGPGPAEDGDADGGDEPLRALLHVLGVLKKNFRVSKQVSKENFENFGFFGSLFRQVSTVTWVRSMAFCRKVLKASKEY